MGLTVFSAKEPEQVLQLFLTYTQRKGRVACCVIIHVGTGKGCREVPVLLCLGCGGKEQRDAMVAHFRLEMAFPLAPRVAQHVSPSRQNAAVRAQPYLMHREVESISSSRCRSHYGGAPRVGKAPGH